MRAREKSMIVSMLDLDILHYLRLTPIDVTFYYKGRSRFTSFFSVCLRVISSEWSRRRFSVLLSNGHIKFAKFEL